MHCPAIPKAPLTAATDPGAKQRVETSQHNPRAAQPTQQWFFTRSSSVSHEL